MNVVRVKAGVRFDHIAPGGFRILAALDQVARESGVDLEISCGTEAHGAEDPHTRGEGYDISVRGFDIEHLLDVRGRLIHVLGPLFTVLYERPDKPTDLRLTTIAYVNDKATAPHLHLQVKNGRSWPPAIAAADAAKLL